MVPPHTRREALATGFSLVGSVAAGGCLSGTTSTTEDILTLQVGSKALTENQLLGHLCLELLKTQDDVSAINRINYSTTTIDVWEELVSGDLDIYWEYTGTLWHEIPPDRDQQYYDLEEMYRNAKAVAENRYDIEVLSMAPFNNSYGLITTEGWAAETDVRSLSGFAAHMNAGNTDTVAGVTPGPYEREDAWPGMLTHYDVREEIISEWDDQRQNVLMLPTGEIYSRLGDGIVDVAFRFTSDAQISRYDLVVLDDDHDFWSVYSPAPVVPTWLGTDYPEIRALLDQLGPAVGGIETIRRLSAQVLFDDRYAGEVAREFLQETDLL
jgi:glycine betaine/choline ABC-type transport system substrate-binding protein